MEEGLCKELGHLNSRGTVSLYRGELQVYDICQRCRRYFIREPTAEERNEYSSLLIDDYSPNLKL